MLKNKVLIDQVKSNIDDLLTTKQYADFSAIKQFPRSLGIYFIYNKNNDLEYIGAGNDIMIRCNQYISYTNTGATFRYNLIQYREKMFNSTIEEIKKNSTLNKKYAKEIKKNYKCKFITVNDFYDGIDAQTIAYWESVCIIAYKPILNKFNL